MATTATTEQLAEARWAVDELETAAANTRYQLVYATEDGDLDRLAAELTETNNDLRHAKRLLGDMDAGADDFHDADEDDSEVVDHGYHDGPASMYPGCRLCH